MVVMNNIFPPCGVNERYDLKVCSFQSASSLSIREVMWIVIVKY